MSNSEISSLENANSTAMAWSPEGYDGTTHYGSLFAAATPALFIIMAAAGLLFIIL